MCNRFCAFLVLVFAAPASAQVTETQARTAISVEQKQIKTDTLFMPYALGAIQSNLANFEDWNDFYESIPAGVMAPADNEIVYGALFASNYIRAMATNYLFQANGSIVASQNADTQATGFANGGDWFDALRWANSALFGAQSAQLSIQSAVQTNADAVTQLNIAIAVLEQYR